MTLQGTKAKVTMLINPGFAVPADATATIGPINLFGADEVSLTAPAGSTAPSLAPGDTIARTSDSDSLGDLFAAAAPLFKRVNTNDLATVITNLAQGSVGEGPQIATSFSEGAKLAALLDSTLQAQLAALDSFANFAGALVPAAGPLNSLSAQENVALPAFNADAADYAKLLRSLTPFAQHLTALLTDYHPDIATLIQNGDNPSRIITAQQSDVGQLVVGLYEYVFKLEHDVSPQVLPDGSPLRLLQHLHHVRRHQPAGLQPDRAGPAQPVLPRAPPAGPGRVRLGLQLLERAGRLRQRPGLAADCRRGCPAPPRAPKPSRRCSRSTTRSTAWSRRRRTPRRSRSATTSTRCSGAAGYEDPQAPAALLDEVLRLRA